MSMYTDLIDNLEILKLDNIKNMLPGYLDEMKDKNDTSEAEKIQNASNELQETLKNENATK